MYVPQDLMWQRILKSFLFFGWTKQGLTIQLNLILPLPVTTLSSCTLAICGLCLNAWLPALRCAHWRACRRRWGWDSVGRPSAGMQWPELAGNGGEEAGEEGDRHETSVCHASFSCCNNALDLRRWIIWQVGVAYSDDQKPAEMERLFVFSWGQELYTIQPSLQMLTNGGIAELWGSLIYISELIDLLWKKK